MARNFNEIRCISCGTLHRTKNLKKIHKKFYCKKCATQLRKQRRNETIKINGIEEDLRGLRNKIVKERGYARKYYVKKHPNARKYCLAAPEPLKTLPLPEPVVKNSACKPKKKLQLFLTKEEKQILFGKYIKSGLSYEEADQTIKDFIQFQRELLIKLKKQNKTDDQINEIFKQEFWKLCQE